MDEYEEREKSLKIGKSDHCKVLIGETSQFESYSEFYRKLIKLTEQSL